MDLHAADTSSGENDAEADHDNTLAVILATATNHPAAASCFLEKAQETDGRVRAIGHSPEWDEVSLQEQLAPGIFVGRSGSLTLTIPSPGEFGNLTNA